MIEYPSQPHDLDAERAVLGAMMLSQTAVDEVLQIVSARDFYHPRHERLFEIAEGLRTDGKPCDAIHVNAELQASGELQKFGPTFVLDLITVAPPGGSAAWHAKIVRDRSILRKILETSERFRQMAYEPRGVDADELVDQFHDEMMSLARYGLTLDDLRTTLTHTELLGGQDSYEWLVPGLIERRDRVMLTGAEGLGKSMLSRQIAVCAAAGLHPFTRQRVDPVKVLVLDFENGPALSRRRYRQLIDCADRAGAPVQDGRFWIDLRPEGINLLDRQDIRWFMRRVEAVVPDLIVTGPIYKMHYGNPNDEEPVRAVATVLDRARALYGSALLIETHSPHSDGASRERPLRPLGSTLWMRWPDYGFGIRLVHSKDKAQQEEIRRQRLVDRLDWRVARDTRSWPKRLQAGKDDQAWPWVLPVDDAWHTPELPPDDPHDGDRGGW